MSVRATRLIGAAVLVSLWMIPQASADTTISVADPGRPVELVVRVPYARIRVTGTERSGTEGSEVRVEVRTEDAGEVAVVIPPVVTGNRIELLHPRNTVPVEIVLEVPRRADLVLESSNGSDIGVRRVHGTIEIVNSNAGVLLEEVGGAATVSTSNGPITARFTHLDADAIVSLVTSNAEIEVGLPESFSGRLLAETDTGTIESAFEVEPQSARDGLQRRPGRLLEGRVGDGEALVRLRTDNAGIRIDRVGEASTGD